MFYTVLRKDRLYEDELRYTFKENVLNLLWLSDRNTSLVADVSVDLPNLNDDGIGKSSKLVITNIRTVDEFVNSLSPVELADSVKRCGYALHFINNQTSYLCELGVQQDGMVLFDVKEQTPYICQLAIKNNPRAIRFVKEQTPYLCELAVKKDGLCTVQY